jgi:hypothetical protein
MSKEKKPADIYVEPLDRFTDAVIRRAILEKNDSDPDQQDIPLKINGKKKNVIHVTPEFFKYMEKSKNQIATEPLSYNVYTKSEHGRFLNLPRASLKRKPDAKAKSEKIRLNNQLKEMVEKRSKK